MTKSYFEMLFKAHQKAINSDIPLLDEDKLRILEGLRGTLGAAEEIERFLECEKLKKNIDSQYCVTWPVDPSLQQYYGFEKQTDDTPKNRSS
jgi:hypothetical protein